MGDDEAPAAAPARPLFKPKFAPKLPVKAEAPSAAPEAPVASAEQTKNQTGKHEKKGGRLQRNSDREKGRGDRGGGRGNAKAGRGQWSMPMGTSFFTGNAAAGVSKTRNITIGGGGGGGSSYGIKAEGSAPVARVARPNEDIGLLEEEMGLTKEPEVVDEESDSDASVDGQGADEEGREVWPPRRMDPLAPVQLPLGPSTVAMRKALAAQPILADPADAEALEREELTSLFLVQMPSDLRFASLLKSTQPPGVDASERKPAPAVHVGKLQLLRSGKVRMVTDDGKTYDVSSGLAASFQQCLTSVTAPAPTASATAPGSLCLMGNVTKKLVLTPSMGDYMETLRHGAKTQPHVRDEEQAGDEDEGMVVEDA